jgi:hypothetical protein
MKMHVGMLWYDADRGASLNSRVRRAADHYRSRYGDDPDLCLLHPSMLGSAQDESCEGIRIESNPRVLPDHLWMGVAVGQASPPG